MGIIGSIVAKSFEEAIKLITPHIPKIIAGTTAATLVSSAITTVMVNATLPSTIKKNNINVQEEVILEQKLVMATINDIAELSVLEYKYVDVYEYKSESSKLLGIKIPFSTVECTLIYDGTIRGD